MSDVRFMCSRVQSPESCYDSMRAQNGNGMKNHQSSTYCWKLLCIIIFLSLKTTCDLCSVSPAYDCTMIGIKLFTKLTRSNVCYHFVDGEVDTVYTRKWDRPFACVYCVYFTSGLIDLVNLKLKKKKRSKIPSERVREREREREIEKILDK